MIDTAKKSTRKQMVKEQLLQSFAALPLNAKLPPDRELAERYGVAFLTINRVMGELEREGYVLRVPRRGTFLASRERVIVSAADSMRLSSLIFVYPNYFSYDYWVRLQYAEETAVRSGLSLVEYKINPNDEYGALADKLGEYRNAAGIIILPVPGTLTVKILENLDTLGIPVVVLEPLPEKPALKNIYSISQDWQKNGYLQARALLEGGKRRLAYIGNEPASAARPLVIAGIKQALAEFGLSSRKLTVAAAAKHEAWMDSRRSAYELVREVMEKKCDGLMFDSLVGASGALRALRELQAEIPGQVAFVAVGNNNGDEQYMSPQPSTVAFDLRDEMRRAVSIIAGKEGAHRQVVDAVYYPRESV